MVNKICNFFLNKDLMRLKRIVVSSNKKGGEKEKKGEVLIFR